MHSRRDRILSWLGYTVVGLVSGLAFLLWAPWTDALHLPNAEKLYGREFPSQWNAVVVNHGQFRNEPWGIPADHPIGYAVLTFVMIVPPVIVFLIGFRQGLFPRIEKGSHGSDV
jgi:hypothetical protein